MGPAKAENDAAMTGAATLLFERPGQKSTYFSFAILPDPAAAPRLCLNNRGNVQPIGPGPSCFGKEDDLETGVTTHTRLQLQASRQLVALGAVREGPRQLASCSVERLAMVIA